MSKATHVSIITDTIGGGSLTIDGQDVPNVCGVEVKSVAGEPTHVIIDLIAVSTTIDITTMSDRVRKFMVCPACKTKKEERP